jgi:excinuclease ABC subunit C
VLSRTLPFSPERDQEFFQDLPAAPAVFLLRGEGEPYLSKTANLRRRLERLLGRPSPESKRLNLRERARELEFTATGSDFESQFLLYQVLRKTFPKSYAARLRLRPPPLIKLHLENPHPRASVTTRLGKIEFENAALADLAEPHQERSNTSSRGEEGAARLRRHRDLYYGPFRSRAAAEKFSSDVLDFFKMRRCVEDLQPDPSFPGCVYSEMKMCLAPCFKGCTETEYATEVGRVKAFFDSSGESLKREFSQQREQASAELAFEEAAAIHAKIEKLKPVVGQLPEIVRRIDRLNAILVLPGVERGAVSLFRFAAATLQGPVWFAIEQGGEPQSMESRLAAALAMFPVAEARSTTERAEHLAILKRWYYRSQRSGEIFFADEKGVWPLRRIVRGIGRVYRGEKAQEAVSFSATESTGPPS